MAELQQNRYDQLIRRVGGIIGPGSMVSEAIGELFPMMDVERVPGELLALMGTGLAWGRAISIAVAGQNSRCQLFNPVGSGKIIAVSALSIRTGTANIAVEFGVLGVTLAALSAVGRYRDTRFGLNLEPVGELRTDSNVGATPATYRYRTTTTELDLPNKNTVVVLTPGFGVVSSNSTVNQALETSYMWRERVAEPSELNL